MRIYCSPFVSSRKRAISCYCVTICNVPGQWQSTYRITTVASLGPGQSHSNIKRNRSRPRVAAPVAVCRLVELRQKRSRASSAILSAAPADLCAQRK